MDVDYDDEGSFDEEEEEYSDEGNENGAEDEIVSDEETTKPESQADEAPPARNGTGKVDFASNLKKTGQTPEQPNKAKEKADPQYLKNLKKADGAINIEPEYKRLARTKSGAHVNGEHAQLSADELMNLAFTKAEDVESRDSATRRGLTRTASSSGADTTFKGMNYKGDERVNYKTALKQHVPLEERFVQKEAGEKPAWAQQKRTIDLAKFENRQSSKSEAPQWAAQRRGFKTFQGIEKPRKVSAGESPDWAHLASKPNKQRLAELETKKVATADQEDFRGLLHKGSAQDDIRQFDLPKQTSLEDKDVKQFGWKLVTDPKVQNGVEIGDEPDMKQSSFIEKRRRKSDATRISLASSLPSNLKKDIDDTLMDWAQDIIEINEDIEINDFTTSWEDGMAFCYLMHFYFPEKVNPDKLNPDAKRSNFLVAFQVASDSGISINAHVDDFVKSRIYDGGKVFDVLYDIYCHFHGAIVEWGEIEDDAANRL